MVSGPFYILSLENHSLPWVSFQDGGMVLEESTFLCSIDMSRTWLLLYYLIGKQATESQVPYSQNFTFMKWWWSSSKVAIQTFKEPEEVTFYLDNYKGDWLASSEIQDSLNLINSWVRCKGQQQWARTKVWNQKC